MIDALTLPLTLLCAMAVVMGLMPHGHVSAPGTPGGQQADDARTDRPAAGRLTAAVLITVALLAAAYLSKLLFVDFDTNSTALEAPICLALLIVFTLTVPRATPMQGVYIAVWAQILASLTFECINLVSMNLAGPLAALIQSVLTAAACAGLFAATRRLLAPQLRINGTYPMSRRKLLFTVGIAVMFLLLSNYQLIFLLLGSRDHSTMLPVFRMVVALLSLLVLYLQNDIEKRQQVQLELGMVQQLWQRQQSQYEIAKEHIDIINRKCHDLKYQLAAFRMMHDNADIDRQLGEVERAVMIYDATFATGNPVLDVVLTEKSLYCEEHRITLTCMADGGALGFVEQTDLYALFGNALDNAIESVMKQSDPDKRIIQVSVYPDNGFLMIRFRNYCDDTPTLRDGLPVTTKMQEPGYHGYGLRGIRYTAEQYGGTMEVRVTPESFTLQVLLPIPTH